MDKKEYTLKEVTKAVNHWSMVPLTSAEVVYFLKKLKDENYPPYPHDKSGKIILLTEEEIKENSEDLKKWRDKNWILQTIFKL